MASGFFSRQPEQKMCISFVEEQYELPQGSEE